MAPGFKREGPCAGALENAVLADFPARSAKSLRPQISAMAMQLACLACGATLCESSDAQSLSVALENERYHAVDGDAVSAPTETDVASEPTQLVQRVDNQVTRCTRCDGSFHSPCVRKLGSPEPFECARCLAGSCETGTEDDEDDEDEEIDLNTPLLVPLQAFAYLRPEWKATQAATAAAEVSKPKKPQSREREIVAQVFDDNSTPSQLKTSSDQAAISVVDGQIVLENVTLIICDGCDLEFDIATLNPPLAEIPEGDWFCLSCLAKTEATKKGPEEAVTVQIEVENVTLIICDGCDVEYDLAALNPPLADIPEGDWFCVSCTEKTKESPKVSEEQAVAPPEVVKVSLIMCDCCELEYDMVTLNPPLTEIPDGEWFCMPCIVKAKKSKKRPKKKIHKDPVAALKAEQRRAELKQLPLPPPLQVPVVVADPEELITILICDGCDAEFDAALIVPKLRRIPKGDWYCHACKANKITRQSPSSTGTPVTTQLETSDNSRRRKPPTIATPPPRLSIVERAQKDNITDGTSSRRSSPSLKRKREGGSKKTSKQPEIVDAPEKSVPAPVKETFPQVFFAPQAVSVVRNNRDDDIMYGSMMVTPGTVLLSEDEGDTGDGDDDVVIVCDICMGEFKMVETLKEGASRGVPPRPWYCTRCLKSLKKTRKKRQRISKQMMLEMQIYGGLLRATAEKTVDPETASLRGRPPSSLEEMKQMHALVGQRVGIFFKWDKHWVMGRVVKYLGEHADHRHLVRFDDETEQTLPLYAFPMVIGTQTMLYVKVPAMQSQWWPAHLLRMNAKAKKLLLRTREQEEATMRNFRLVSLFAEGARAGKPQHVSCWVPKYLCRSMHLFSPPSMDSSVMMNDFSSAVKRSEAEKLQQQVILCGSIQNLIQQLNDKQWSQMAGSIVGKDIMVRRKEQNEGEFLVDKQACFRVLSYNAERQEHGLEQEGTRLWLDLRNDETRFMFANASDYGEWAVLVETTINTTNSEEDEEGTSSNKQRVTKSEELAPLARSEDDAPLSSDAKSCSVCLLPEFIPGDNAKKLEAMIECVRCASSYHLVCCDPPYDPFSLRNDEDGAILIDDTKAPFVCHQCITCAGCHTALVSKEGARETGPAQNQTGWVQWRLRLQSVSLCDSCVDAYGEERYCSVCHLILKDEDHVSNLDLLSCSSCHLWVHANCEPDPNPAFHKDRDAQFDLDVVLECLQLKQQECDNTKQGIEAADDSPVSKKDASETDTGDNGTATSVSTAASKSFWSEEFRPSRIMDEETSLTMKFDERYNPKILNNYECFTCRKVRMLRVIHRLILEDKLELFKEPVTKNIAPTYFDVIKSPMDLSTMQSKVLSDAYPLVNFAGFRDDFELICLNAVTFNSKERDFLVWREAWRFYGQGQRIFRQIAPKSRMKHRGGKSYDALAIAAKRQLPSNSVMFGKTQDGDTNDSMFPDENDLVQEEEQATKETDGKPHPISIDAADNTDHMHDKGTELAVSENDVTISSHEEIATIPSSADTTINENNAATATNELAEHRRVPNGEASSHQSSAVVLQKELDETPRPESRMDLIRILQSRPIAHTYCWMDMCARCGSAGLRSKMIFCIDCGEAFHSFCVDGMTEERLADNDALKMFWRCTNCKMCELCGKPGGDNNAIDRLHFCGHCDRGYHGFCMTPSITAFDDEETKSKGKSSSQRSTSSTLYCASCVSCHNCGQRPREGGYSYDRQLCLPCSSTKRSDESIMKERSKTLSSIWTADARKQKRDAERCPMCDQKWSAEDHELMQCDVCERWAHPKCDVLLTEEPERYRVLVEDPSAAYICGVCRPKERSYLSNVPHSWKCQVLISKIQEKRRECHGQWRESRTQLAQSRQWQQWRDNTPVFLYILRLGEECLKNLAYRSVNFQENWYRFTKENELVEKAVVIPNWLVQKASRYLRFKRYARGPKAARRRHARKQSTFYSQLGVEKHPEASAVCTIVSEASSCAALLACVHLFYGWRPLSKVVLHMLEQDDIDARGCRQPALSDALLSLIRIDDSKTLEEEIAMIKTQYERRVGKRHLVVRTDTDQVMADAQVSPTTVTGADDGSPAITSQTGNSNALTVLTSPREPSVQSFGENGNHPLTPRTPRTPKTPTQVGVVVATGPPIQLTTVDALYGWPTLQLPVEEVADSIRQPDFVDSRYCVFCYMVGDDTICGRLIYTDMDQWVHVNCALWSVEVYEDDKGVLQKCQRALNRGRNIRCDGCGVLGATIGCSVSRCQRHYHFPCALDYGVAFLPNGQTCCPLPSHMNMIARKMAVRQAITSKPSETTVEIVDDKREETSPGATAIDEAIENADTNGIQSDEKVNIVDETPSSEQQNGNIAVNGSDVQQSVLPVIIPSHEPYRCLRSDMASYVPDRKRRVHTLKTKRQLCFRIGALTVHSLGHIMVGNASFHSQHALFPLGFRSTRIFWSTQVIQQRCVYECVVTSTLIEAKKQLSRQPTDESEDDQEHPDVRALFKIIPSDDREHPIVASTPDDALLTLRSRVVSLYERSNCFAASDINPMLNRSSWFSFGLVGSHFFGFGLSEIAKELEQLPHVATTGISRQAIAKLRKSRKRKHDVMENDTKPADPKQPDEEPYVFTHHLPSPRTFDEAQTEIERLVQAEERARLSSGSARTDGYEPPRPHDLQMTKNARRRLNKHASSEAVPVLSASSTSAGAATGASGTSVATGTSSASTSGANGSSTNSGVKGSGVPMDIEHLPIAMQYRELRRRPFDERLEVRKSKIHGYGLFTKEQMVEGQMIVEYQGQMISQDVADEREKAYEEQGIGSCYMFRLDEKTIIDATRCGNLARFINHSCDPKAYARVVCVDGGNEKKIVIFAKRTIEPGDEVTYDYKFPIEDEAIRCDCSAPNCIGRMN